MIYILQSEVNIILCQRLSYYPLMTGKACLTELMLVAKVSGSSYVKSPHKGHRRPNLERGDLLATGDVQYYEHTLFNKKS